MAVHPANTANDSTADSPANSTAILVADAYLGNLSKNEQLTEQVKQKQAAGCAFTVHIDHVDCCKGRIFTETADGQTVGIVKGRSWSLTDGDVLATQTDTLILIALHQQTVIALRFDHSDQNLAVRLVHLGHVLGNHHWPISLIHNSLYVEQVADIELMQATIRETATTLGIRGLQITTETKSSNEAIDFKTAHNHEHAHTHAH
ncbi:MAG: urease accessory protein UreE [Cyanobacteria bacterium J06623_5]